MMEGRVDGIRLVHLNDDSSWFISLPGPSEDSPIFNILIDPWLSGSQVDYFAGFSRQTHAVPPAYASIPEVEASLGPVGAIVLSHEFTDHAHQATLSTAKKDALVFGHPRAKQRVEGWKHLDLPAGATPVAGRTFDWISGARLPGKTLHQLGKEAKWPEAALSRAPDHISLLYVPTDDRFDPAGDRLHGLTIISWLSTGIETVSSIVYSPHGLPASAVGPLGKAYPPSPTHRYVALIHHFDRITMPLLGVVNMGPRESGLELVAKLKPERWIRTHDELKKAGGAVGRILKRQRGSKESIEGLMAEARLTETEVLILASGESIIL